jgi:hypothetical protein
MIFLGILGGVLVAAGLAGLGWCIAQGYRIRAEGGTGAEVAAKLKGLIAVNLASVAGAALGLALLTAYFVLR